MNAASTGRTSSTDRAKQSPTSPWKLGGLSFLELLKITWKEVSDDNAWDSAAALGYYFLFALFPMLLFLLSILFAFSSTALMDRLLATIGHTMPWDAYRLLANEVRHVLEQSAGTLITLGMLGTLWAASSGVVSIMDGLNRAYEVRETRSFMKRHLMALGLTVALAMLAIVGAGCLVASDKIAKVLFQWMPLPWVKGLGISLGIVVGLAGMFLGLELMFYFGPNVENPKWYWATPGSLAAVLIWIIVSFGFSEYLRFGTSYSVTYGGLGAVMVLMLWLYILGLAIVIGGEMNSEIAKAARARGNPDAPLVGEERTTSSF